MKNKKEEQRKLGYIVVAVKLDQYPEPIAQTFDEKELDLYVRSQSYDEMNWLGLDKEEREFVIIDYLKMGYEPISRKGKPLENPRQPSDDLST